MGAEHQLVHYTKSVETIRSILEHGFVLIPNKRQLIHALLPKEDFSKREPQEFGMVSFTELDVEQAREHRSKFGQFGIGVAWDWASRNGAQRVLYIDEDGFVFNRFSWLFELASQEMHGEPVGYRQALVNKNASLGMGAQLYHAMLTFYEYMEPSPNSAQIEWRIVNQLPAYRSQPDRVALIAELVRQAKISPMYAARVEPNDVVFLTCRAEDASTLRESLPAAFRSIPIHAHSRCKGASSRLRSTLRAFWGRILPRERIRWRDYAAPPGSVLLPATPASGMLQLPRATRVNGIALYPDRVASRVHVAIQYDDEFDKCYEVRMPVTAARALLGHLAQMEQELRRKKMA